MAWARTRVALVFVLMVLDWWSPPVQYHQHKNQRYPRSRPSHGPPSTSNDLSRLRPEVKPGNLPSRCCVVSLDTRFFVESFAALQKFFRRASKSVSMPDGP